jgi:RNA polymerase sigma factor (TIGR02999 family)
MSEVTRILSAIEQGDTHAAEQLLPLVYDELRPLAAQKMAQERSDQTLQATALVHEAYIRLVDTEKAQHWNSWGHFFAAAAEAMRRILVDNARRKKADKRGGASRRVDAKPDDLVACQRDEKLIALDEALAKFEIEDQQKAELIELRYFAGLTTKEAAATLGISTATADRYWNYARAWLQREMAAIEGHPYACTPTNSPGCLPFLADDLGNRFGPRCSMCVVDHLGLDLVQVTS